MKNRTARSDPDDDSEWRSYRCPVCGHVDDVEIPTDRRFRIRCSHCRTPLRAEADQEGAERIAVQVAEDEGRAAGGTPAGSLPRKRTLDDLADEDIRDKCVFVRVDFNVPLEGRSVAEDSRIRRTLPTLERLLIAGARVVLLSHLGRPGGEPDPDLSLEPVARRLGEFLNGEVEFLAAVAGQDVVERVGALEEGRMLLLENTRFHPGEKADDPDLARSWAELADLYVNDAFGAAHRAHASTRGLPEAVRRNGGMAVAGLLMEEELRFLDLALRDPDRPFVALLGGAKISGKIDVVEALLPRVDRILVGGAMANTFFRALGLEVGRSLVEEDRVETARALLERAGGTIVLPVDCVVADRIAEDVSTRSVLRGEVGIDDTIGDIGPATRDLFREELTGAETVVWNGPMGVFELDAFAEGTVAVARAVADVSDAGALTVVGGGDSAAALRKAGVAERIVHVSTGGGASLELLAGEALPGILALSDVDSDPPSRIE